ncbi:predicted protein [Sclerotinia sclerotiorum 1980 UF-70]|uniref:Uncharacterized protein n=1 Tax=Sclerotinia sclerotiorum (strain ATCC 18683 / 1980 / Ss-1) TaxID=665079 RepID=A7F3E9_SCLS1|nr:predicted protein [Sclerotinia sclerotiorum 1980 UF-70]EDN97270.1 predicted protein [Sclerotinia sclerotiorum 1980 UF-70]
MAWQSRGRLRAHFLVLQQTYFAHDKMHINGNVHADTAYELIRGATSEHADAEALAPRIVPYIIELMVTLPCSASSG